jgi:NAD(P)-dependent dehydrogenase (short-subunit alcohol dehydrogenase family)
MGTYVVSGSASGMGLATATWLRSAGHEVIGVDVRDADVVADLSMHQEREDALSEIGALCRGRLDGVALFAGLVGLTGRPSHLLASVNYFGSVELFEGLRPMLAASGTSFALAVCSNSMTCQPGISEELVTALLAGDEVRAREVADEGPSVMAYPATKTALARWLRRHAPTPEWIGQGIRLNAIAPGVVETPMVDATRADPVLGDLIKDFKVPIGRGATATEVAELAGFMLTKATFMVGSVVLVDGGTEAELRPDVYPTAWVL